MFNLTSLLNNTLLTFNTFINTFDLKEAFTKIRRRQQWTSDCWLHRNSWNDYFRCSQWQQAREFDTMLPFTVQNITLHQIPSEHMVHLSYSILLVGFIQHYVILKNNQIHVLIHVWYFLLWFTDTAVWSYYVGVLSLLPGELVFIFTYTLESQRTIYNVTLLLSAEIDG